MPDIERAKHIIVEIVRQAGGALNNKTNLFKAFYHAHLSYAENAPGYLSDWPIVRMPRGPGIHAADRLLGELVVEGVLHVGTTTIGDREAFQFRLTEQAARYTVEEEAARAVREGVQRVAGKSTGAVSNESHEQSRSWQEAKDGEELNIYVDAIPEAEFRERSKNLETLASSLEKARADTG